MQSQVSSFCRKSFFNLMIGLQCFDAKQKQQPFPMRIQLESWKMKGKIFTQFTAVLLAIFLNYHKSMAIFNLQLIYRSLIASNNRKINRIKKKLAKWTFSSSIRSQFLHIFRFSLYSTNKWWTLRVETSQCWSFARKSFHFFYFVNNFLSLLHSSLKLSIQRGKFEICISYLTLLKFWKQTNF